MSKQIISCATKRIIDIFLSTIGFLVSVPVILLIGIFIKFDSKGHIFFKQQRVGKGQKIFTMWKFRTMVQDADKMRDVIERLNEESTGLIIRISNDPRVTRVGKILRSTSLDELPQFLNVLKGDMSIVGPRPPSPDEVAKYNPQQLRRLEVKPGMTGLWQVSGRKDTPFDYMVKRDVEYIDNQSLWLDIKIMLKTIFFMRKGAY
jgi:lipopolysaccharide/colanic/teichoic acid biosynthesis glycosyltransferase